MTKKSIYLFGLLSFALLGGIYSFSSEVATVDSVEAKCSCLSTLDEESCVYRGTSYDNYLTLCDDTEQ